MKTTLWDRWVSPPVSLAAALLLLIPFSLLRDPLGRTAALLPLMVPLLLAGRPGRIIPTLITFAAITALGLFPAAGKELFRWHFVVIGSESLLRGMSRASLFCGMMLLSRMAIRPGLAGRGSTIGGILATFEWFNSRRGEFRAGDPAGTLDRLLLDCDTTEPVTPGTSQPRRTSLTGWILLFIVVLAVSGALLLPRFTGPSL